MQRTRYGSNPEQESQQKTAETIAGAGVLQVTDVRFEHAPADGRFVDI